MKLELFAEAMRSFFRGYRPPRWSETYDFSGNPHLGGYWREPGIQFVSGFAEVSGHARDSVRFAGGGFKGAPSFYQELRLRKPDWCQGGGNFFESIPSGGRRFTCSNISWHDWSDEDCLRILKNIYAVAEPGTKLLIVDAVIGAGNEHEFGQNPSIFKLPGPYARKEKERTHAEWKELLHTAGVSINRRRSHTIVRSRGGSGVPIK